ncbi:MAG: hypothetical protein AB1479_09835 [Pseudomonadota bacterium]
MNDSNQVARLMNELRGRYAVLQDALSRGQDWIEIQIALRDVQSIVDLLGNALGEEDWAAFRDEILAS